MGRAPCCEKNGLKRGPWTPEEDQKLVEYIRKNGQGNWRTLPKNAGEFARFVLFPFRPWAVNSLDLLAYQYVCVICIRAREVREELSAPVDQLSEARHQARKVLI